MLEKFGNRLACSTIQDIIQKAKTSDTYPLPLQASYLCDLAQALSTRTLTFFLHNKKVPEMSSIVLDLITLLHKVVGILFAPQGYAEHLMVPSQDGILRLSQIKFLFPDLDSSLIMSLLSELKFCLDVSDPNMLSLFSFGRVMKTSAMTSISSSSIALPQYQLTVHEKMPNTSLLFPTVAEDHEIILHQNTSGIIPESLTGPTPIPSTPKCERANESCSPQWCTAPLLAAKISDQLYAMGASAGGSQPLLYSMSREVPNDIQKSLHQWTSFHSLQSVPVQHLTQSQSRLSTSSLEKNSLKYESSCFSSKSSSSSIALDQKCEQNHGTKRTSESLSCQSALLSQALSELNPHIELQSSYHAPSNIHLSPAKAAKKVVPIRRRSPLVQTQHLSDDEKYLFFPGLVSQDQPSSGVWLHDKSFVSYSGWCLQCKDPHHFFSPRFTQTLILCLTSDFVASNSVSTQQYTVWKNGLRWLSQNGIENFVELREDGKALVVLMRTVKDAEMKGVKLRSSLIKTIFDIKDECCPSMTVNEYFIDPGLLQKKQEGYPVISGQLDKLTRYDVQEIARAMVHANCGAKGESCTWF